MLRALVSVLGCALMLPILLATAAGGILTALTGPATSSAPAPGCAPGASEPVAGYAAEQVGHAATIVAVGQQHHVPPHGWVVALAVALQESSLHNLDHGDRDSLGLFQQRPSQGWGNPAQLRDPVYAAAQFYTHLQNIPGWQAKPVTEAAQAVQNSGTPAAYARHEASAEHLVAAVDTATCTPTLAA